jgi:DNA primase
VESGLDPAGFTMESVLDRVAEHGDLYAPVLGGKQSLKTALKSLR